MPKLKIISMELGYADYVSAVAARIYLGDRSAITESLDFFDEDN